MGSRPRAPALGRTPRGGQGDPAGRRGRAPRRHRDPEPLRLLLGQLCPARGGGADPDGPVRAVPARGGRPTPDPRRAPLRDRAPRPPAVRGGVGHLLRGGLHRGRDPTASPGGGRLFVARRDPRGSPSRPARRPDARELREPTRRGPRRARARRGAADPHRRRAAIERLPPVGERVRRVRLHDADVARLPRRRPRGGGRGVPRPGPPLRRPVGGPGAMSAGAGLFLLWSAAIALAGLGTGVLFDAALGLNWSVWTLAAAGVMLLCARIGGSPARASLLVPVALAAGFGIGATVSAAPPLHAVIVVAVAVLFAIAVLL